MQNKKRRIKIAWLGVALPLATGATLVGVGCSDAETVTSSALKQTDGATAHTPLISQVEPVGSDLSSSSSSLSLPASHQGLIPAQDHSSDTDVVVAPTGAVVSGSSTDTGRIQFSAAAISSAQVVASFVTRDAGLESVVLNLPSLTMGDGSLSDESSFADFLLAKNDQVFNAKVALLYRVNFIPALDFTYTYSRDKIDGDGNYELRVIAHETGAVSHPRSFMQKVPFAVEGLSEVMVRIEQAHVNALQQEKIAIFGTGVVSVSPTQLLRSEDEVWDRLIATKFGFPSFEFKPGFQYTYSHGLFYPSASYIGQIKITVRMGSSQGTPKPVNVGFGVANSVTAAVLNSYINLAFIELREEIQQKIGISLRHVNMHHAFVQQMPTIRADLAKEEIQVPLTEDMANLLGISSLLTDVKIKTNPAEAATSSSRTPVVQFVISHDPIMRDGVYTLKIGAKVLGWEIAAIPLTAEFNSFFTGRVNDDSDYSVYSTIDPSQSNPDIQNVYSPRPVSPTSGTVLPNSMSDFLTDPTHVANSAILAELTRLTGTLRVAGTWAIRTSDSIAVDVHGRPDQQGTSFLDRKTDAPFTEELAQRYGIVGFERRPHFAYKYSLPKITSDDPVTIEISVWNGLRYSIQRVRLSLKPTGFAQVEVNKAQQVAQSMDSIRAAHPLAITRNGTNWDEVLPAANKTWTPAIASVFGFTNFKFTPGFTYTYTHAALYTEGRHAIVVTAHKGNFVATNAIAIAFTVKFTDNLNNEAAVRVVTAAATLLRNASLPAHTTIDLAAANLSRSDINALRSGVFIGDAMNPSFAKFLGIQNLNYDALSDYGSDFSFIFTIIPPLVARDTPSFTFELGVRAWIRDDKGTIVSQEISDLNTGRKKFTLSFTNLIIPPVVGSEAQTSAALRALLRPVFSSGGLINAGDLRSLLEQQKAKNDEILTAAIAREYELIALNFDDPNIIYRYTRGEISKDGIYSMTIKVYNASFPTNYETKTVSFEVAGFVAQVLSSYHDHDMTSAAGSNLGMHWNHLVNTPNEFFVSTEWWPESMNSKMRNVTADEAINIARHLGMRDFPYAIAHEVALWQFGWQNVKTIIDTTGGSVRTRMAAIPLFNAYLRSPIAPTESVTTGTGSAGTGTATGTTTGTGTGTSATSIESQFSVFQLYGSLAGVITLGDSKYDLGADV